MFPVDISIQISPDYIDSEIEDLVAIKGYALERDIKPRSYRKKPSHTLEQYLNNKVHGRQKQIYKISTFIQNLKSGEKSPLCLHGSTGCGKTSIITQLINYLKHNNNEFQTLYINCLNFTNIKKIYSSMLQNLFERRDKKPQQTLSYIFSDASLSKTDQIKLIVFDEIDQCFNSKAFIYNILQWVQISTFPFGVILISNMIDFTANLQSKSKSRMKFNSIIFAPYHYEDLIDIVKHKYKDSCHKFQQDTIIFLCKKVASINSDVRLLEKYYTDALRKFGTHKSDKINISQIQTLFVSQESGLRQLLKPYEFILQILWRSPRGKNIQIDIEHYCLANGIKKYSEGQVVYMLTELKQMRVIKLKRDRRASNFYYGLWGIDLQDYAYTLQATSQR